MKFLVTGGAGYVGSHFVREALRQGHECLVIDSLERGHKDAVPKEVPLIVANIKDEKMVMTTLAEFNPDVIVHYAAYALVGESVEKPRMYLENNVGGVEALLKAMKKAKVVVPFIFSSTCAVFGSPKKLPMAEDDAKAPESPYGESKLLAEKALERAAKDMQFSCLALRYFNACGADADGKIGEDHKPETHLIPNILKGIAYGRDITIYGDDYPTTDGTCVRDYIHVTDLAEAHIQAARYLLAESKVGFDAIHLGTGQGQSNLAVVKAAADVVKKEIKVKFAPRRPGDPAELYADNKKAEKLLGFVPRHSDLNHIIKTAWQWHKNHPDGYQSKVPSWTSR